MGEAASSDHAIHVVRFGVVMGRQSFLKTVEVLRKTIEELEADPTIDTAGPAFVDLKCSLLNRILELEEGKAPAESVIHLVNSAGEGGTEVDARVEHNPDSAIA